MSSDEGVCDEGGGGEGGEGGEDVAVKRKVVSVMSSAMSSVEKDEEDEKEKEKEEEDGVPRKQEPHLGCGEKNNIRPM